MARSLYSYFQFKSKINKNCISRIRAFCWLLGFSKNSWCSRSTFVWRSGLQVLDHHQGRLSSAVQWLFDLLVERFHKDSFGTLFCPDERAIAKSLSSIFEKLWLFSNPCLFSSIGFPKYNKHVLLEGSNGCQRRVDRNSLYHLPAACWNRPFPSLGDKAYIKVSRGFWRCTASLSFPGFLICHEMCSIFHLDRTLFISSALNIYIRNEGTNRLALFCRLLNL